MIRRIHVIPTDDTELHCAQVSCWCHPTEIEENVWTHNAGDVRGKLERAGVFVAPWVLIEEDISSDSVTAILVNSLRFLDGEELIALGKQIAERCGATFEEAKEG